MASTTLHPELHAALATLQKSVPSLASLMDQLAGPGQPSLEDLAATIENPLDRAKLHVHLAFTLHSALHAYLKVNAADTKADHIKAQLDRLKGYFEKLKKADEWKNKRSTVDQGAAGRLIKGALAANNIEDKKAAAAAAAAAAASASAPEPASATPAPVASASASPARDAPSPAADLPKRPESTKKKRRATTETSAAAASPSPASSPAPSTGSAKPVKKRKQTKSSS
ncbi:DNA-binding protein c1d [Allomyces javanicus]|nr:DNA-binding protein c1d [Allomyces javanicus]